MLQNYNVGDKVKMTSNALENYGQHLEDKIFVIEHVATSTDEHPGYDDCTGDALYDLEGLGNSLYDYELESA